MKKAQVKNVQKLVERFRGYVPDVLMFRDPEDVHQMRVTGRTLMTIMDFVAGKKERKLPEVRDARKSVKGYMRMLGELRDLDVMIDELRQRMAVCDPSQLALLARWVKDSEKERDTKRERTASVLPGVEGKKFARILEGWEGWLEHKARAAPRKNIKKLRADAQDKLEAIAVLDSYPIEDEAFLNQVHMARINVKKLRYALAMTGDDAEEIERLKAIQDDLGRAQDLRVWISRLEKYRKPYRETREALTGRMRAEIAVAIKSGIDRYKAAINI